MSEETLKSINRRRHPFLCLNTAPLSAVYIRTRWVCKPFEVAFNLVVWETTAKKYGFQREILMVQWMLMNATDVLSQLISSFQYLNITSHCHLTSDMALLLIQSLCLYVPPCIKLGEGFGSEPKPSPGFLCQHHCRHRKNTTLERQSACWSNMWIQNKASGPQRHAAGRMAHRPLLSSTFMCRGKRVPWRTGIVFRRRN